MTKLDSNLIDSEILVNKFLLDRQSGLVTLYKIYFKNNNQVSYRAFIEELFEELKIACEEFIGKNSDLEELNQHLFYISNSFGKNRTKNIINKSKEFICPGCEALGKQTLINQEMHLICTECFKCSKLATDLKWINFFNVFKRHAKVGFRCLDCNRFIPQPLSKSAEITCPYVDCLFVGSSFNLKKMMHPNIDSKYQCKIIKNINDKCNNISKINIDEGLNQKIKVIKDVIDQQNNNIYWDSFNFTIKHKSFVYQAFKNLLDIYPVEMTAYLLDNSRSGGFQHKLFQEYISILESHFPIPYKKNKQVKTITSLLDSELALFDGISTFEAEINDNGIIKNNTKEIYIGGRTGANVKPYYIGKLLNIISLDTKDPIIHLVENYSFSRIKLNKSFKNTKVLVTHLRIPPHYQMGGMVHINRIRKKIIDKVNSILEQDNEIISEI